MSQDLYGRSQQFPRPITTSSSQVRPGVESLTSRFHGSDEEYENRPASENRPAPNAAHRRNQSQSQSQLPIRRKRLSEDDGRPARGNIHGRVISDDDEETETDEEMPHAPAPVPVPDPTEEEGGEEDVARTRRTQSQGTLRMSSSFPARARVLGNLSQVRRGSSVRAAAHSESFDSQTEPSGSADSEADELSERCREEAEQGVTNTRFFGTGCIHQDFVANTFVDFTDAYMDQMEGMIARGAPDAISHTDFLCQKAVFHIYKFVRLFRQSFYDVFCAIENTDGDEDDDDEWLERFDELYAARNLTPEMYKRVKGKRKTMAKEVQEAFSTFYSGMKYVKHAERDYLKDLTVEPINEREKEIREFSLVRRFSDSFELFLKNLEVDMDSFRRFYVPAKNIPKLHKKIGLRDAKGDALDYGSVFMALINTLHVMSKYKNELAKYEQRLKREEPIRPTISERYEWLWEYANEKYCQHKTLYTTIAVQFYVAFYKDNGYRSDCNVVYKERVDNKGVFLNVCEPLTCENSEQVHTVETFTSSFMSKYLSGIRDAHAITTESLIKEFSPDCNIPAYNPNRNYMAFTDGVLELRSNRWFSRDMRACWPKAVKNCTAVNYFDLTIGISGLGVYLGDDYRKFINQERMPKVYNLIMYQIIGFFKKLSNDDSEVGSWSEEKLKEQYSYIMWFFLAMTGRCLYNQAQGKSIDKAQIFMQLVGGSGTGKGTWLNNVVTQIFPPHLIANLPSKWHAHTINKQITSAYIAVCTEYDPKNTWDTATFNNMTSGELVRRNEKHEAEVSNLWTAPIVIASNYVIKFDQTTGQENKGLKRREVAFNMDTMVDNPDPTIEDDIKKNLGLIIIGINIAYLALVDAAKVEAERKGDAKYNIKRYMEDKCEKYFKKSITMFAENNMSGPDAALFEQIKEYLNDETYIKFLDSNYKAATKRERVNSSYVSIKGGLAKYVLDTEFISTEEEAYGLAKTAKVDEILREQIRQCLIKKGFSEFKAANSKFLTNHTVDGRSVHGIHNCVVTEKAGYVKKAKDTQRAISFSGAAAASSSSSSSSSSCAKH